LFYLFFSEFSVFMFSDTKNKKKQTIPMFLFLLLSSFLPVINASYNSSYILSTYLQDFCMPTSVWVDGYDAIVTDHSDMIVRKNSLRTGETILAGKSGSFGNEFWLNGNKGLAILALLNKPWKSVLDLQGNLYVSDRGNNEIRMINKTNNIISLVAGNGMQKYGDGGGNATKASLSGPSDIWVDSSLNLFIADTNNNRIRKVILSSNTISTIAGKDDINKNNPIGTFSGDGGPATSAGLNKPYGVCSDSLGNVYFSDTFNHRIRRIDNATRIVQTIAGNSTIGGYNTDKIHPLLAKLNFPYAVWLDSVANIYFVDKGNSLIRKIITNGGASPIIINIAGIQRL
jgi:hypothetical protein